MGILYIANCTKQNLHLQYRVPEQRRLGELVIPIGAQRPTQNLTTPQMSAVIEQLEASLGAIAVQNLSRSQTVFAGVCYDIDKPVQQKAIMSGLETNVGILEKQGHDLRVLAGVAISERMGEVPADPNEHRETTVDIVEQSQDRSSSKETLRSTVHVRGKGQGSATGGGSGARKRARG